MPSQTDPGTSRHQFDLIPGKLNAQVYLHSITAADGPVPCWTYVTDGLWAHGQKELIFSLRRDEGEQPEDIPRGPLKLFTQVYRFAEGGQLVDVGGLTQFGGNGFLGRHGIAYIRPQQFAGIEIAAPSLAAVLLTEEELETVKAFGITRVMARLGKLYSYFPCPPWSDRLRPGLQLARTNQESILARTARGKISGMTVCLERGQVVLRLVREAGDELEELLDKTPSNVALALLADLDSRADACLAWEPGQTQPFAITAPSGGGSRVGGCFLFIAPGQPENGGNVFEDGFVMMLTDESWAAFRRALQAREALSIPASKDAHSFSLQWTEQDYVNPINGSVHRSEEGWQKYEPTGGARARSDGPVEAKRAVLLTSEPELAARVDCEALGLYLRTVEDAAQEYFAGLSPAAGQDLLLQFELRPGDGVALEIGTRPGIAQDIIQGLHERLVAQPRPPVNHGPIQFQSIFTVWGGSGNAL